MKRFLMPLLFILACSTALFATGGTTAFVVATGELESYLLNDINANGTQIPVTQIAKADRDWDYFNVLGDENVVAGLLHRMQVLSTSDSGRGDVIIGHSQGGLIARRMAQRAAANNITIKGYIATSAPLEGDMLANSAWRQVALAALSAHLVGIASLHGTAVQSMLNVIVLRDNGAGAQDPLAASLRAQLPKGAQNFLAIADTVEKSRANYRDADMDTIGQKLTLPLMQAMFPDIDNSRDFIETGLELLLPSSFGTIGDMNPMGSFMGMFNSPTEMAKESNYTRAFLVSTNGDLYDTPVWSIMGPVINADNSISAAYTAAYWRTLNVGNLVTAALYSASAASITALPNTWSYACSGNINDFSGHDGFVQNNVSFNGNTLKMVPPDCNTSTRSDFIYYLPLVSHVDTGYTKKKAANYYGRDGVVRSDAIVQYEQKLVQAFWNF
jgi:pimeloyl-ACP methyl ester carboxylesterase